MIDRKVKRGGLPAFVARHRAYMAIAGSALLSADFMLNTVKMSMTTHEGRPDSGLERQPHPKLKPPRIERRGKTQGLTRAQI